MSGNARFPNTDLVGVEREVLEDDRDVAVARPEVGDVLVVEQHAPGVELLEAEDRAQRRRLARARRPEDGEELAVGDVERDVVHGRHAAEALADALEADPCHQRTANPVASSKTCTWAGSKWSPSALPIAGRASGGSTTRTSVPSCSRCTMSFGPERLDEHDAAADRGLVRAGVDDAHALRADRRRESGRGAAALEGTAALAELDAAAAELQRAVGVRAGMKLFSTEPMKRATNVFAGRS